MTHTALLLVDHGSKKQAANDMLFDIVELVQNKKSDIHVEGAHMELASPSIEDGIQACINKKVSNIIVQPFMLSPGRHTTHDIPNMVHDIMKQHPYISYTVSSCLGTHDLLATLILERSGLSNS